MAYSIKPHFVWICSYMGTVSFRITDDGGTYEADLRVRLEAYERSILNGGEEYARELDATIGFLIARYPRGNGLVPLATVQAFNEWRMAEHEAAIRKLEAAPERYGEIPANDPIRTPPVVALGSAGWTYDGEAPDWRTCTREEHKAAGSWKFQRLAAPEAIAA